VLPVRSCVRTSLLVSSNRCGSSFSGLSKYMAGNVPAPSQETASLIRRLAGPSTGKAGFANPSCCSHVDSG